MHLSRFGCLAAASLLISGAAAAVSFDNITTTSSDGSIVTEITGYDGTLPAVTPGPDIITSDTPPQVTPAPDGGTTSTTSTSPTMTSTSTETSVSPTSTLDPDLLPDKNGLQDQGPPLVDEDLLVDEQVVYLTYLANDDKDACLAKAYEFANSAPLSRRRRLAAAMTQLPDEQPLQKRGSLWRRLFTPKKPPKKPDLSPTAGTPNPTCVPGLFYIPLTVHWIVPAGADWRTWSQPFYKPFVDQQMTLLNTKMSQLNMWFDLQRQYSWQSVNPNGGVSPGASAFSQNTFGNLDHLAYVTGTRRFAGSTAASHLNLYIVDTVTDEDGSGLNGYCKYAGEARRFFTQLPDACVVRKEAILGASTSTSARLGTTLPHEFGHWMNLFHPQDGGCSSKTNDYVSDTPAYDGIDYTKTCDGTPRKEYNIMSYSPFRTRVDGVFTAEQRARAMTGLAMRRTGYIDAINDDRVRPWGAIKRYMLDNCQKFDPQNLKGRTLRARDVQSAMPFTKRQAENAYASFCESSNLTIANYAFTERYAQGIFNDTSYFDGGSDDSSQPDGVEDVPQQKSLAQFAAPIQKQFKQTGKVGSTPTAGDGGSGGSGGSGGAGTGGSGGSGGNGTKSSAGASIKMQVHSGGLVLMALVSMLATALV
ncbi:hypothetical protein OC861_005475 [Tilletia horrida]|nr:hypothetical protein OC861_005475 [Tilletia horrida]